MFTGIGGLEDPTPRSARHQLPRRSPRLPERGVNDLRVVGVENEVGDSGRIIPVEHASPCFATIGALVYAALGARSEDVTLCADINNVWVGGIDAHSGDLPGIREADGRPRLAAIARAPHAISVRHIAANRILAGTDVDDVGVGFADSDCADGAAEILVGDRRPGHAAVRGLKDTSAGSSKVVLVGALARAGDGDGASTAERPDLAPLERGERGGIVGRRRHRRRRNGASRNRLTLGEGVERGEGSSRDYGADCYAKSALAHEMFSRDGESSVGARM